MEEKERVVDSEGRAADQVIQDQSEAQTQELEGLEETVLLPGVESATPPIDPNTATLEELQELPGIGTVLAQRIVDLRAEVGRFKEPTEILAVRGISETMYERMAGRLVVEPAETEEGDEPWPEAVPILPLEDRLVVTAPEGEWEPGDEPEDLRPVEPVPTEPEVRRPPIGEEPPLVQVVPGPAGWGRMLLVGLLSAIVGAVLALVFLYMLNGTVDFRAATERTVQGEVARFEGELQAVRAELEQVESQLELLGEVAARLDEAQASIEELRGAAEAAQSRLESMSEEVVTLRQEFNNVREDVDGMAGLVSDLGQRVDSIDENVRQFDAFLNGLAGLLDRLLGGPRPTPTPSSATTAVPRATATPSGQ